MSTPEPTPATPPAEPPQGGPPAEPQKDDRQTEIDRIVADRLAREKRQHAEETKELRKQAAEADKLRKERETETEKAIREAEERGRTAALAATAPRLVLAEMRAAAAGRIDPDRFDTLTEDLDLSKYLTDAGGVDLERVQRKVAAWAPAPKQQDADPPPAPPSAPRRPRPDPTQGTGRPPTGDADRGRAEALKRFGDRARIPS